MTLAADSQMRELRSLSRHASVALIAILGLFGGLVFWASTVEISGAVIGQGSIAVASYAKHIQHQEGGIVKEILVRNEDVVDQGQLLLVLDDTATAAGLAVVTTQLLEAKAREARLLAELDAINGYVTAIVIAGQSETEEAKRLVGIEDRVMSARLASHDGKIAQLREQVTQLERQVDGLKIQQTAAEQQFDIAQKEFHDTSGLLKTGLVEAARVSALQREMISADSQRGNLIASIAQANATIAERRLQITQATDDFLTPTLADLQNTRRTIAEATEQQRAALDRQQRTRIRAPQAGMIHESTIHTVGGVVAAGETIMQIVPQNDELIVNVRTSPMDIDKISVDQPVTVRLSSFDQRRTPELFAKIAGISPDLSRDTITGQLYYSTEVRIPEDEENRLGDGAKLVPGMPVQAFIKTADRSVLSYLIHPFIEELNQAFRED